MPAVGPGTTGSAREQRLLKWSIVAAAAIGVLGIGWGWFAGSQAIMFDGAYTALGLLLSWLSLRASQIVASGPTINYPFGREALAPLVIMIQGVALLGTLGYAAISSVLSIIRGGTEVAAASGMLYAGLTGIAALALWLFLKRYSKDSDLIKAEAVQWLSGTAMSAGMLVAFGLAAIIDGTSLDWLANYVDPVLVVVASVALFPIPWGMVRETARELLEGAPPAAVQAPVRQLIAQVTAEHGLDDPLIRMSKLGAKLYLEVDYVVPAGRYDTAFADDVRRALKTGLQDQPLDVWLNVDLSTDASWQH
ncbi:MAG TPA: cation transporter [Propionicimonas sp.]|nr:cation transporter [Propionicimonas sp.]